MNVETSEVEHVQQRRFAEYTLPKDGNHHNYFGFTNGISED